MVVRELFAKMGLQVDGASFSRADAMIGGLKSTLIGMGAALTAGAVYQGLKSLVENTAAAARESGKAAQRAGVTRVAYEELAFAAEHSGLSAEGMEQSLRFLNRSIYEGGKRGGEAGRTFRALGVDIGKGARSADLVLGDLAARFQAMPDGPRKSALAMQLFGRSGTEMIPMLNKGRAGIAELREEAHRLGMVFSNEDITAAKEYGSASKQLHVTLESLQRAIAIPLMHQLAEGKKRLAEWLKANRELIRERVVWFVTKLAGALESLSRMAATVIDYLVALGKAIAQVAEKSQALKVAFVILGAGMALALAPVTVSIVALLGAIEEIWGWITGSRNTLLEDWLGPFDKLRGGLGDSPLRAFLLDPVKEFIDLIDRAKIAWDHLVAPFSQAARFRIAARGQVVDAITEMTPADGASWTLDRIEPLLRDPAIRAMMERPTAPGQVQAYVAERWGALPPITLTIGSVNVGAGALPPGANPDDFAQALGQSLGKVINEHIDARWGAEMSDAYPAGAR